MSCSYLSFCVLSLTLLVSVCGQAQSAERSAERSAEADTNTDPLNEGFATGDLLVNRMKIELLEGRKSRILEATSFDVASGKPVVDQCRFEAAKPGDLPMPHGTFANLVIAQSVTKTVLADFDMLAFMNAMPKTLSPIFDQIVEFDELRGPVFKKEDFRDKLKLTMGGEPYTRLPSAAVPVIEGMIEDHVNKYWAEVVKLKGMPSALAQEKFTTLRNQGLAKLAEGIRNDLKERARGKVQTLKSDQLTKTRLLLTLKPKTGATPVAKLECFFEGEKAGVTLQRLNAALGGYFEVLSPEKLARENETTDEISDTERSPTSELGRPAK